MTSAQLCHDYRYFAEAAHRDAMVDIERLLDQLDDLACKAARCAFAGANARAALKPAQQVIQQVRVKLLELYP